MHPSIAFFPAAAALLLHLLRCRHAARAHPPTAARIPHTCLIGAVPGATRGHAPALLLSPPLALPDGLFWLWGKKNMGPACWSLI